MHIYHITFGTYGARLHGGEAPTVSLPRNHPGDSFVEQDDSLWNTKRSKMKESACNFATEQREFVEGEIPSLCVRGKWTLHISACQPDHVHVLLSAEAEPKAIRKWLKTWLSQSLNTRFGRRTWFAEGGSGKWVNDEEYFNAVYQYILNQRTTPLT